MVPFRLWNNDSLPAQFCIDSLTGGKPTQNMDKDTHGTTLYGAEINRGQGNAAVSWEKKGPQQKTVLWRATQWQDRRGHPSKRR